jgi:WD40 repeat protein
VKKLENRVRIATDSSAEGLSNVLEHAEDNMERIKWLITCIPFSGAVGGVGSKVRDLSEQIPLLANEVKVDDVPDVIKSLSINKGVEAAFPAPGWSQIIVGIGKIIHVYDFRSGQHEFELGRHKGRIQDLAVSPDERKAASTGMDCVVKVWDIIQRRELMEVGLGQSALHSQSFVHFTGLPQQHLACSGFSFGYPGKDVYFHGDARVVLSGDGSIMVEARYRSVSLIATASMTTIRNIPVKEEPGNVAITRDGKYLYIRQTYPQEVTVVQVGDGAVIGKWVLKDEVKGDQLFVDERGKVRVIAGTRDGAVKTWDIASGAVQTVLRHGDVSTPIVAVGVAENVASTVIIAALREDGIVQIWNLTAEKLVIQLGVGEDYPISKSEYQPKMIVMLSPDGSKLFVRRGDIIATCGLHGSLETTVASSASLLPPPPPPPPPPPLLPSPPSGLQT